MSVMSRLIAGAMSGTSADGVDVALVRVEGRGLGMTAHLVRHHYRTYDPALRRAIFAVRETGSASLAELARIGREISLAYAACVNEALLAAGLSAADVAAVAAHGQTLYHAPPDTIQWLDPALIAAQTRCPVVSDFRRADCAAGGQGAPLVPFADYIIFRHPTKNRVLLNVGGIANLTYIPAGASIDQVIAFDTGPGNCISDWVCRTFGAFGHSWDPEGQGASRGRVVGKVYSRLLTNPFFSRPPPKSTDTPSMISAFETAIESATYEVADLLATAAYFTAATIATAIKNLKSPNAAELEIIASGGGVHNKAVMGWLRSSFGANTSIRTTGELGMPSDAKEAIAFALLAAATLDNETSNVPSCTGANRRAILGSITPRP